LNLKILPVHFICGAAGVASGAIRSSRAIEHPERALSSLMIITADQDDATQSHENF
jgi:hypothetical protein